MKATLPWTTIKCQTRRYIIRRPFKTLSQARTVAYYKTASTTRIWPQTGISSRSHNAVTSNQLVHSPQELKKKKHKATLVHKLPIQNAKRDRLAPRMHMRLVPHAHCARSCQLQLQHVAGIDSKRARRRQRSDLRPEHTRRQGSDETQRTARDVCPSDADGRKVRVF